METSIKLDQKENPIISTRNLLPPVKNENQRSFNISWLSLTKILLEAYPEREIHISGSSDPDTVHIEVVSKGDSVEDQGGYCLYDIKHQYVFGVCDEWCDIFDLAAEYVQEKMFDRWIEEDKEETEDLFSETRYEMEKMQDDGGGKYEDDGEDNGYDKM